MEMSDLRLNNKICFESENSNRSVYGQECDLHCYKYEVTMIQINLGFLYVHSCYCIQMSLQILSFSPSPFSNIYSNYRFIINKYTEINVNKYIFDY